jgi:Protein of unknown function (DUF2809)
MNQHRAFYLISAIVVVLIGVASRLFHSGLPPIDKYLGDALYAILVYILLSIAWLGVAPARKALAAGVLMAAIEIFQLSYIPARMAKSGNLALKLGAIILGTSFSWYDLLAYAVGILLVFMLDRMLRQTPADVAG